MEGHADTILALTRGVGRNPQLSSALLHDLVRAVPSTALPELVDATHLTAALVRQLAERGGTEVEAALVYRQTLRAADFDEVPAVEVVVALLDNDEVPTPWLQAVLTHPAPDIRGRLAESRYRPAEIVRELAKDPDPSVAAEAATWARRIDELDLELASHPHASVRSALARNRLTPPDVLEHLAGPGAAIGLRACDACPGGPQHGYLWCDGGHEGAVADIHCAIAYNRSTPSRVCERLARESPDERTRAGVAGRTDLSAETYRLLAQDAVPWVVGALAANPAIGMDLLRLLATSQLHDVQRRVATNPEITLDLLTAVAGRTKIGATEVPRILNATEEEIRWLARSHEPEVRMLVASRPDLHEEIVEQLTNDRDAKVLKAVAPNPRTGIGALTRMLSDHGGRVAVRVAMNPACTPELLSEVLTHGAHSRKVFRAVAIHPAATVEHLVTCLSDDRAKPLAAANPRLPVEVLVALLEDGDPHVVEAAAAALPREALERVVASLCARR